MVESGVTEGGKNTASFHFREWTQQLKLEVSSSKATILKVIPEEKQQPVEKKGADNIRKVLCKSFIQWFGELNLYPYKYRVSVLIRSAKPYSFVAVEVRWIESLEI